MAAAGKRVCLIGDSHLAALGYGWKTIASEYPHVDAHFFASPGRSMQHVTVKDGELVPATDELAYHFQRTAQRAAIDNAYDLYVVYALHCAMLTCPDVRRAYRQGGAPSAPELIAETIAGRVLPRVRAITGKPVVLVAGPMIGESLCTGPWAQLRDSGEDAGLAAFFNRSCAALAESVGARFLPQPEETLASPLHTRNEFASGQARFSETGEAKAADGKHMNAAYGAIIMRQVLREFGI